MNEIKDRFTFMPGAELQPTRPEWPRMKSRWLVPPRDGGWDFALSEWSLEKCSWTDRHQHVETNTVLEGELHVEVRGETAVLKPGDSVVVPAGEMGRYTAPVYARMIAVYGPNPGVPDADYSYQELQ